MTFTALNSLEDDSSFASSSMAQVPFSPVSHRQDEDCSDGLNNYAQHPLAQSDPSLQLTMQSRRPSLKPGFGAYLTSPRSSSSPHYYHHQKHETNTLYHAPSNISLSSEGPSSSIYSNASLNSSMDTMAISSSSTTSKYDESIYGSSFASSFTTFSGFSALNDRKRSVVWLGDTSSLSGGMVEQNTVSWKHDGPFGLHSASEKTGPSDTSDISSTPSTINEPSGTMDYFSNFTSGPVRDCTASTPKETIPSTISSNTNNTNNNNKRPHPGNINSASKPPLHKSYTFDAISTSPTKKYMRMDENWSSSTTTTHPFVHTTGIGGLDYNYANGIGFSSGSSNGNPGMMLESPFEMDFNGTQNQKGR